MNAVERMLAQGDHLVSLFNEMYRNVNAAEWGVVEFLFDDVKIPPEFKGQFATVEHWWRVAAATAIDEEASDGASRAAELLRDRIAQRQSLFDHGAWDELVAGIVRACMAWGFLAKTVVKEARTVADRVRLIEREEQTQWPYRDADAEWPFHRELLVRDLGVLRRYAQPPEAAAANPTANRAEQPTASGVAATETELFQACGLPPAPSPEARAAFDMAASLLKRSAYSLAAVALATAVSRGGRHHVQSLPLGYGGPTIDHTGWYRRADLTRWLAQLGAATVGKGFDADTARRAVEIAIEEYWMAAKRFDDWRPGMRSGTGLIEVVRAELAGMKVADETLADAGTPKPLDEYFGTLNMPLSTSSVEGSPETGIPANEPAATAKTTGQQRPSKKPRTRASLGGANPKYPKGLFREARTAWKQYLKDRRLVGGPVQKQSVWLYDDWLPRWCEAKSLAIEVVLPELVTGEKWEERANRFWLAERQSRRDRKRDKP